MPWWRAHVWWIVAVLVVAISAGVVWGAGTRPGYDPYGWLIWGYQSLHWNLNLGGAPSWKPLPLLFDVPFALFGSASLWLWMVTSVAVSFAGSIFAGRVAYTLVDRWGAAHAPADSSVPAPRWRRWGRAPAIAAALFAALGMYGIQDDINGTLSSYMHYLLSVQSDPMIVTLVLAAIDLHLQRRRRWVLVMLGLAALGRPEVWPALGLYMAWCWLREPALRAFAVVETAFIAFMWFGIPTLTNGRPLIAGDLAERSPRELHESRVLGTLDRFRVLNLWPVWVLAGLAVAWAGWMAWRAWRVRRAWSDVPESDQLVLGLGALVIVWLIVEVAFSLHGWPAVPRYMFEPAVVCVLLGGIGLGRLLAAALAAARGRGSAGSVPGGGRTAILSWTGAIAGVALCVALVPGARARIANEHRDLTAQHQRTDQINHLATLVHRIGGRASVLRCGRPVTNVEYVSVLGWLTGQNTGLVGHRPQIELHEHYPIVLFTQLPNGWASYAWHTHRSQLSACRGAMNKVFAVTPGHPNGVTVTNRIPPRPDPPIRNLPLPG